MHDNFPWKHLFWPLTFAVRGYSCWAQVLSAHNLWSYLETLLLPRMNTQLVHLEPMPHTHVATCTTPLTTPHLSLKYVAQLCTKATFRLHTHPQDTPTGHANGWELSENGHMEASGLMHNACLGDRHDHGSSYAHMKILVSHGNNRKHTTHDIRTQTLRQQCLQCSPRASHDVQSRWGGRLYREQQNTRLLMCHLIRTVQLSKASNSGYRGTCMCGGLFLWTAKAPLPPMWDWGTFLYTPHLRHWHPTG